jgi:hypothetical protein
MNAHINLLDIGERRNPGIMLMQKALGTGALAVIAAVVLYGLFAYFLMAEARGRLQRAEVQWKEIKPSYELAEKQVAACRELERMRVELAAFSNAQIVASGRLLQLAYCVPERVQLTEVGLSHSLKVDDGKPARAYELKIAGRTATAGSAACLESFMQTLRAVPREEGFGDVKPLGLHVDPRVENARESLFEIQCLLDTRRYQ